MTRALLGNRTQAGRYRGSLVAGALLLAAISGFGGCNGSDCCYCRLVHGDCQAELAIPLIGDSCEDTCVEQASVGSCKFERSDIEVWKSSDECVVPRSEPVDPDPGGGPMVMPKATARAVPDIAGVVALSAGTGHVCAILEDATASCWGTGNFGQLGNPDVVNVARPAPVSGLSGVVSISAAFDRTCAALDDGRVACFGERTPDIGIDELPVFVSGITTARTVAVGGAHICALLDDGHVVCWGENAFGELGDGTQNDSETPRAVGGVADTVAITAGSGFGCALGSDAVVACWGRNNNGQLGVDTAGASSFIALAILELGPVARLSSRGSTTCAALEDGSVWCWGGNDGGQIGDGTTNAALSPSQVPGIADAIDVVVGPTGIVDGGEACALHADGTISCWGGNDLDAAESAPTVLIPVEPIATASAFAAGRDFACALLSDQRVWCWGDTAWIL